MSSKGLEPCASKIRRQTRRAGTDPTARYDLIADQASCRIIVRRWAFLSTIWELTGIPSGPTLQDLRFQAIRRPRRWWRRGAGGYGVGVHRGVVRGALPRPDPEACGADNRTPTRPPPRPGLRRGDASVRCGAGLALRHPGPDRALRPIRRQHRAERHPM